MFLKLYIVLEIILYILLIINKVFLLSETWLDIFTLLPVLFTTFYFMIHKKKIAKRNHPLSLAIHIATLGDLSFIYIDNIFGIYFFFLIQLCLIYYLHYKVIKKYYLLLLGILIFILCYFLNTHYLIVIAILYFILFLYNLNTLKEGVRKGKGWLLFLAFLFLAICDIQVFLVYIIDKLHWKVMIENLCFGIEWCFYILFQVLLTYYVMRDSVLSKN